MTLRAVRERSANRFKPSAVGGYERGERAITLERFCDLCSIYGIGADDVLKRVISARKMEIVLDPESPGEDSMEPQTGASLSSTPA